MSGLLLPSQVAVSLVAAAALAAATGSSAAPPRAAGAPVPLVGQWTRTVTPADFTREGSQTGSEAAACSLRVKASGALRLDCGQAGADNGTLVPLGAGRVRITIAFGGPGSGGYRWKRAGRRLTLMPFHDASADRRAVFQGVWKQS